MEMEFEWDPAKAASNLAKHRIDFEDAIALFYDSYSVVKDVTKPVYGEVCYLIIGMMADDVMAAVVYTHRGSRRRLISARRVRKDERRLYDNHKASTGWYDR
ncbi:MAG: BrnT family toxin [Caldilineaceae bacterium]|nr:BrnT family toxin [Caldilineaceae bacterium]